MLPLIPIAIVGLGGLAYWRTKTPHGMTPERKQIYEQALISLKDPEKLRTLGDAFEKEGLKDEATMLRKRALLREMPPEVRAKRQQAFGAAMKSKDPSKVEAVAMAFQNEGATGAAANLRKYAAGLRASKAA